MSSTGRGSEREEADRYYSRYPLALAICERLRDDGIITNPRRILEPSAGAGAFVSAAAEVWRPEHLFWNDLDTSLILAEHHERALAHAGNLTQTQRDFVHLSLDEQWGGTIGFDLAIGNPPFTFAEQHVRHGISLLAPGGVLAFLLPVNFLGGIKRTGGLYQEHPPEYVYLLDKRPQFLDGYRINKHGKRVKKGTDSNEYGMFVFRKERPEFEPVLRWLQWSTYLKRFANVVGRVERRAKVDDVVSGG